MWNQFISLLVTLFAVVNVSNSDPVPWITKCRSSDDECLRKNAITNAELFTKGLPEYNVETLDPMSLKSIDCSTPNLKLIMTDSVVKGLSKCNIKKLARNTEKSTLLVNLECDIIIDGKYEIDGNLLLLPIQGKGDLHATIRKIEITGEANMVAYNGKDGKQHWKITTWTHKFELHGKSKLKLTNLFNGNKVLSKSVEDAIENESNTILEDIGDPVVTAIIAKLAKNVSAFWKIASIEDLSLDN